MGGKNPMVVLDDADLTVQPSKLTSIPASFSTGQRCTASSRLIVTEGIHDKFVAALTEKLKTLNVDNAMRGRQPYRSGRRRKAPPEDRYRLYQDRQEEGAKLAWWRDRHPRNARASTCSRRSSPKPPTEMRISREEIFGPVVLRHPRQGLRRKRWQLPT